MQDFSPSTVSCNYQGCNSPSWPLHHPLCANCSPVMQTHLESTETCQLIKWPLQHPYISIHTVYFSISSILISRAMAPCGSVQAIGSKLGSCKSWRPVSSPIQNSAINFAFKNPNVPQAHDKKHERDHHWPGKDLKQSGNTTCNMYHYITNPNNANMQGSLSHYIYREIPPKNYLHLHCVISPK